MNNMSGLNRNVCLITAWTFQSYIRMIVTKSSTFPSHYKLLYVPDISSNCDRVDSLISVS